MKQWQVLRTIFTDFITENFEFVDYNESDNQLGYWLHERGYMSREDYKKGTEREYGLTEECVIQDLQYEARPSSCISGAENSGTLRTEASFATDP